MKSIVHLLNGLALVFILLLAVSCKKDSIVRDDDELAYSVTFAIHQFSNTSRYLAVNSSSGGALLASTTPNVGDGYLYFWSFNNESINPDIKYDYRAEPSITYNNGIVPTNFNANGFAFEDFAAGKSVSMTGAREVFIKMPIHDVIAIRSFAFDITSTNTGPKDFEIYYSIDEGDNYVALALNNQFGNVTSNTKNSFSYELDTLSIQGEELWMKLVMKAGERGSSGEYNESQGVVRLDNIRLVGEASTFTHPQPINELYYFIFHKDKPGVKSVGVVDFSEDMQLQVQLPMGEYDVFFVSNTSQSPLIFPSSIEKAADIYCSNLFSNHEADIFGYVGTLTVSGEQVQPILLTRLFSQIKIEFTDAGDLSLIKELVVTQQHEPFFYAPFGSFASNPILDQTSITFTEDFSTNKQVVFNQFLGLLQETKPVLYQVEVYGANGLLRTFQLGSSLKNNMQLVFRGELLNELTWPVGFQIIKNENWEGSLTDTF